MRIVKYLIEEVPAGGVVEKEMIFNHNQQNDITVSEMYFQLPMNMKLEFTGFVDENDTFGTAMSLEDMGNFEIAATPDKAGIFMALTGSLQRCKYKLTNTGTADKVFIKSVY